ncbi:hypothetical protein F4776DRAFT_672454 [Hypoxylon sp. NC0597]|nr:hypothetical protein F4776DRAFT_672454 [Hypoxylon sp. NC0597]
MSNPITRIPLNNGKTPTPPPSLLFLRTTSGDAGSSQIATRSRSSYDIATIIAASQLVEHQERHGSDALPPEDVFALWLEENRERFIKARKASRSLNSSGPKRSPLGTRSVQEPVSANRVSSRNRPSSSKARERGPKHQARRDGQEGGGATGICRHIQKCRRRVCGMGKRVGRLFSRACREKHAQLDVSEKEAVHKYHNSNGLFQGNEENSITQEETRGDTSASDNNSTMYPQQRSPQGNPGAWALERIEEQSMETTINESHPNTPRRASYSSNTTTLGQSEREAAPSPPEQRGPFHISQVAHLAPTYIAAERSRARSLLNSHQTYDDDRVSGSSDINTGINTDGNQVARCNGLEQRQDQNRSGSSLADRDALQARIRDAGFLSGEVWLDGLNGEPGGRVGLRFVARPLRNAEDKGSSSRGGSGLLPTADGRKVYGSGY